MAKCDYCGTTILFGGHREGKYRYCNERCRDHDVLHAIADQVPDEQMDVLVDSVRHGECPLCSGPGPIDVHTSHVVWSILVMTSFSSKPHMCCRRCAVKKQLQGIVISGVVGWWGFPWGILMTPIQIGRNVWGLFSDPGANGPSEQFEKMVRLHVAGQIAARSEVPAEEE